MSKHDGGPAFPLHVPESEIQAGVWSNSVNNSGMSLRDYFAAKAMLAMLPAIQSEQNVLSLPATCYKLADAMLAERNKPDEQ